ncbi:MAG: transposase domain-containing protein [Firmicutes bacterium]|nr:transposase domain-containing protein [Bacillota bacterium]
MLGRKNWLFADSQDGARALAICYMILETAKANHLDIRKYLDWLLSMLPRIPESSRQDELESMLPWDPEVQRFFRTRDY